MAVLWIEYCTSKAWVWMGSLQKFVAGSSLNGDPITQFRLQPPTIFYPQTNHDSYMAQAISLCMAQVNTLCPEQASSWTRPNHILLIRVRCKSCSSTNCAHVDIYHWGMMLALGIDIPWVQSILFVKLVFLRPHVWLMVYSYDLRYTHHRFKRRQAAPSFLSSW